MEHAICYYTIYIYIYIYICARYYISLQHGSLHHFVLRKKQTINYCDMLYCVLRKMLYSIVLVYILSCVLGLCEILHTLQPFLLHILYCIHTVHGRIPYFAIRFCLVLPDLAYSYHIYIVFYRHIHPYSAISCFARFLYWNV